MSPRLDLPIAVLIWFGGFLWVGVSGSWTPLAVLAIAGATRLVAGDAGTRHLLRPRLPPTGVGLAAAAVMISATYLLYGPTSHRFPTLPVETRRLYGLLRGEGYAGVALPVVIAIIAASEEIIWRGRVLASPTDAAAPGWPTRHQVVGVLVKMAIYGAAHAPSRSVVLMGIAFACGVFWGLLRIATRSLWASILTHVLWDMTVMVLFPLA